MVITGQSQLEASWLFGSRSRGRQQPSSDIDLCFDAPQSAHSYLMCLINALDDLFFHSRVDLLLLHQLDPEVRAHLHRVGSPIWKRQ